jgi:hypothetical protein
MTGNINRAGVYTHHLQLRQKQRRFVKEIAH